MKVFTFFTTLLLCAMIAQPVLAQPDVMPEIEKVLEEGRRSMTLPQFLDLLGLNGEEYKTTRKIKDVEEFKFRKKMPYNKVSFKTHWFNFAFMTDARDKILFSSVELLGIKAEENQKFTQIHVDFEGFVESHEQFYNTTIDLTDKLMLPLMDYTLEINETNELCKQMLIFVKNNDTEHLEKWLKSMNTTIQSYAVIGFEIMKIRDDSFKTSKTQTKYINHVKTLESTIPFISSFDTNTEIAIKDALTESYVETYWYLIKDSVIFQN
ncbi:MAG: hypothetical protein AB8G11_05180 [Saprospiraceae bacterium]